jgi:hypothetical protein
MRRAILIPFLISCSLLAMQAPSPQRLAPNDLVRKVVTHEIQIDDQDHSHWMYQVISNIPAPRKISTVVETKNGNVECLDNVGGRPLTRDQRSAEDRRIQSFVADQDQQSKSRRANAADDKKSAQLFGMLPDAFLFNYAESTGDTVKLNFRPNPDFTPHSSDAYVFHKMDGFVILNTREDRLVEISGRLSNGVEFLGGLLGHLDPGGTFDVRREEIAPSHWAITRLEVNMNGKMLFFKTISVQQDEVHSHFQRIPDGITLAEAKKLAEEQAERSSTE